MTYFEEVIRYSKIHHLKLFIGHPLLDNYESMQLAKTINKCTNIQKIQIISESKNEEDTHPNWTNHLTAKNISMAKLKTKAKTIFFKNFQLPKYQIFYDRLSQLEETDPLKQYQTDISNLGRKELRIVLNMEEWRCVKILCSNHDPDPIQFFKKTAFNFLTQLHFPGCEIQTLESLTRMWAPVLKSLEFYHNYLFNIDSLRKFHSPSLEYLGLNKNRIKQVNLINEGNTSNLISLDIEKGTSRVQISSISFITKIVMNCHKNKTISLLSKKREIQQIKIANTIVKRMKNLQIELDFGVIGPDE